MTTGRNTTEATYSNIDQQEKTFDKRAIAKLTEHDCQKISSILNNIAIIVLHDIAIFYDLSEKRWWNIKPVLQYFILKVLLEKNDDRGIVLFEKNDPHVLSEKKRCNG